MARTTITWQDATATLDPNCYNFTQSTTTILTAFASAPCQSTALTISGGPTEVRLDPGSATITAHGAPGPRTIQLPAAYGPPHVLDYAGPAPKSVTLNRIRREQ